MPDTRFPRLVLFVNALVPGALLAWDGWRGTLGVNATNFAIHTTGLVALSFLTASLLVTPLRLITHFSWLVQFRRQLGLWAFAYACAHFGIYFWFDRVHNVSSTLYEITHRLYLIIGTAGLIAMVPLAATSTGGMIRRLGPKNWKRLHRLAYLAALAGAIHYYIEVKADTRQPAIYIAVIDVALLFRFVAHYLDLRRRAAKGAAAVPPPATRPRFWKGELKVARVFEETPNVRTFRLITPDGGPLPFAYQPGQYLTLMLDIDGKRVPRSYTIASSPTRIGNCEITVKRETSGTASRHLHDMMPEGSAVNVGAPGGKFTFTGAESPGVVLVAGGVGITPMMSIIRFLTDHAWAGPIDLFFSVRTPADVIFDQELTLLMSRFPNLHVHVTASRVEGAVNWTGLRGRITADLVRERVKDLDGRRVYICGPEPMLDAMRTLFREVGVADDRIFSEAFTSPPVNGGPEAATALEMPETPNMLAPGDASDGLASGGGGEVTFARSGKVAPLAAGRSVLEASEDIGIDIPFDCRSGICGTCKVKLLAGHVSMEIQDALTKEDKAGGLILACQANSSEAITVDA